MHPPFTLQTRISDALAARPELIRLLPAFHPAFEKLAHPVLGKILPRLVTVADAARVAGVDAGALLDVMNLPGPPADMPHPTEPRASEPVPAWRVGAVVVQLDVRPVLARGEEPFAAVMRATRVLPPGQVLELIAPFEPAPLIRLFGERGWRTHVAWEDGVCRTSFWRPPTESATAARAVPADRLARGAQGATLDVRGLEPPEPLRLVLAALDDPTTLPLTVLHHREPALLYPRLAERGLSHEVETITTEKGDTEVRIRIHGA